MTAASSLITAAYRESQLIPIVSTPSTNEQNEALPLLNAIVLSTIGNEAGEELADLNIGGSYDQSALCSPYIPENARLQLNLTGALTLKLHPQPYEGQRLAIVDNGGNLSTFNFTLDANGRTIELDTSETFSDNGTIAEFMYFADQGDWSRLTSLALSDSLPFPDEFDTYWVTRLAMRLNPRNGVATAQETVADLQRIERKLRARYRRPKDQNDMPRSFLATGRSSFGLGINDFRAGRTWR